MSELVKFNELEEEILKLYAQGLNRRDISLKLDLPLSSINRVFLKPNVKSKINEIIENKEKLLKLKTMDLLEQSLDDYVDKNAEKLLREDRDLLDIVNTIDKVNKESEKKRLGTAGGNVLINILQQLGDSNE